MAEVWRWRCRRNYIAEKMNLQLVRTHFSELATIGKMSIDGVHECMILEDCDRGLNQGMDISEIKALKKNGMTCIPYGTYQVIITPSQRFLCDMPLLLNVAGYEGIRIHPGNSAIDTEGCLLPGISFVHDGIYNSRRAYDRLFKKLQAGLAVGKIFVNIIRAPFVV